MTTHNYLSVAQVYDLALQAGFTPALAKVAVAIAIAESGLDAENLGDLKLQNATWGPSIGLWQVRSLKAESGKGTPRDATRLTDPLFNAKAAYVISNGGKNWKPWTTYTSGAYDSAAIKNRVSTQVGNATGPIPAPPVPNRGTVPAPNTTVSPVGWSDTLSGAAKAAAGIATGGLTDLIPGPSDVVDAIGGAIGAAFGAVMDRIVKAAAPVGFKVAGGMMGAALIVYGAKRLVDPTVEKVRGSATTAAAVAAAPETGGASLALADA